MAALDFGHGPIRYPTNDDIDPDTARILFENCPILIVEDMPIGTEFGIDMNVFRVGKKFRGVKMIPPGMHYIYTSSVDKMTDQAGPRSSFFYHFKPQEILVKRWSQIDEDLIDQYQVEEEQLKRYKDNLKDLNNYLGAYQYSTYAKFIGLTDHIDKKVTKRLMPCNNRIRSVTQLIPESQSAKVDMSSSGKSQNEVAESSEQRNRKLEKLPRMNTEPSAAIRFSHIISNDQFRSCRDPSQITKYHLDSSSKLQQVVENFCDNSILLLLGELQFAFVTFMIGHVYDSFEHWKDLIKLICSSELAIEQYPELYSELIRVLHFEIKEVPEDLFVDIVDNNNFLLSCLANLFSNLEHSESVDANLKRRGLQFKRNLMDKFGWDFDLEPDDELPVVVNLCDAG